MPQNPPLSRTENPEPVVGIDTQMHLAGNWKDDDPIALDQYFEAADQEAEVFDGLRIPQERTPIATRLVTWNGSLASPVSNGQVVKGVQVLPRDINRKRVYINAYAADITWLLVASEPFSPMMPAVTSALGPHLLGLPAAAYFVGSPASGGTSQYIIEGHTGALYLGNWDNNAGIAIGVSITAVTC